MEKDKVIESLITPNGKTIAEVFLQQKRYYIDIYQRDYKWDKEQVNTLLKDIEIHFSLSECRNIPPSEVEKNIIQNFKPYFLNTYLTSTTTENVAIVDGQQRLTTFLIIFIKLRQLVEAVHNDDVYTIKTVVPASLDKLIFESNDFGETEYYKIYNENRQEAFNAIRMRNDAFVPKDESATRIRDNYKIISDYYDAFFKTLEGGQKIDVNKLTHYIFYIRTKLNLVEIKIEKQENVATVFEVVNDRGKGLNPYEILKGKFIGNLPQYQKERANEKWVALQDLYYEDSLDLDTFFRTYLRAKFADSEAEYERFEGRYHYEIYQDEQIQDFFKRFEDKNFLYNWVINDFVYYAQLYRDIRKSWDNEYITYNSMLDQNQQYLLIMSAITLNDPKRNEKITLVSKKFDQLHSIIRLLEAYESTEFQRVIYRLNKDVRNKNIDEISEVFDKELLRYLESKEVITPDTYLDVKSLFRWELFQNVRNRQVNFSKYVLMRIDRYLAAVLDKPSYCDAELSELFERFNKNNRKVYGMHLEHIYANNKRNIELFTNEQGIFDDAKFNLVRNYLGVLLLLKDRQNQSSNNDYYKKKVKDYATSDIIWNELLVGHISDIDTRNLPESLRELKIEPTNDGVFPLDKLENRQKAVFEMIKLIWCF